MPDANIISVDFGANGKDAEPESEYDYDRQCGLMRERNKRYLDLFEADMRASGLAESTIHRHLDNVDFYINEYLLYYGVNEMEYGCHDIYGFLGDFFIRKCAWSTPGTIKTNATSIKKFYKCMRENGLVSADAYNELVRVIKDNMADWQADCAEFNDPANDPFFADDPLFGDGGPEELFLGLFRNELAKRLGASPEEVDSMLSGIYDDAGRKGPSSTYENPNEPSPYPDPEPPALEQVIDVFTLALFYLTSWEERIGGKRGPKLRKAWKSADWGALDRLRDLGFIDCTDKAKSVTLTSNGVTEAELLLQALDLGHLMKR